MNKAHKEKEIDAWFQWFQEQHKEMKQTTMFDGINPSQKHVSQREKNIRNFCMKFQRWSDKQKDIETTANGKCGYMLPCDLCEDPGVKNPCAKAMRAYLKQKKPNIDLSRPFEIIMEELER